MSASNHDVRERKARLALEELGQSPSEKALVTVHCSKGHHLGAVYDTSEGRVFHSTLQSRSHGRKDLPDTGHGGARTGRDWYDLLDAGEDPLVSDELQSGCDCGPYQLSRKLLVGQISQGERRVIVE